MQLPGSAAEHCGGIEISSHVVSCQLKRRMFREVHRFSQPASQTFREHERRASLEIMVQLFERPLPSVAFICHQTLQHCQRYRRCVSIGLVFDQTGKWRNTIKSSFLRQEAADLTIRIGAGLKPPKEFENESIAIQDRRITLLCRPTLDRKRKLRRPQEVLKRLAPHTADSAGMRA